MRTPRWFYLLLSGLALWPALFAAQSSSSTPPTTEAQKNLQTFAGRQSAGFGTEGTKPLDELIGFYVSIALGFLGVIFLILALYAGYLWLTAGGNEEQVTKAKDYLRNAIIGILIVAAAFVISNFVISAVFPAPAAPPAGG